MTSSRLALVLALALAPAAAAQAPPYVARHLGPGHVVNDMNVHGDVVGWTIAGGAVRAYLDSPHHAPLLLPHPAGHLASWAQGINDGRVVVGSTTSGTFPEFGQAVAWNPSSLAPQGFQPQFLGQLPGHTQSVAYDVDDHGRIVGQSHLPGFGGGPTVWFNAPSGVLDIAALGAPGGPKEVNDEGVVAGIGHGLFDLDTLSPLPTPPFSGNLTTFQAWAINDQGELAGTGFYGGVNRAATRWTNALGWQPVSGFASQSANLTAFDINVHRLTVLEAPTPAAHFDGVGTFALSSLLVPSQAGKFAFQLSFGGAVNDLDQIAAIGSDLQTGQSGVILLVPAGFHDVGHGSSNGPLLSGSGSFVPNSPIQVTLLQAPPNSVVYLVLGARVANVPAGDGTLIPVPQFVSPPLPTGPSGTVNVQGVWPAGVPVGATSYLQFVFQDLTVSNALSLAQP